MDLLPFAKVNVLLKKLYTDPSNTRHWRRGRNLENRVSGCGKQQSQLATVRQDSKTTNLSFDFTCLQLNLGFLFFL